MLHYEHVPVFRCDNKQESTEICKDAAYFRKISKVISLGLNIQILLFAEHEESICESQLIQGVCLIYCREHKLVFLFVWILLYKNMRIINAFLTPKKKSQSHQLKKKKSNYCTPFSAYFNKAQTLSFYGSLIAYSEKKKKRETRSKVGANFSFESYDLRPIKTK
jgi:hypothetical protein